ncbi:3',5'-cyclic-nucleotide phosphodiesterase [Batrachochytrium dendrobatidis]|nr:3',5'-cyclic-nucleotide phosphodiesterase [Batrachochytrium dendrobatidis]KAK5670445.1 3',5'-cyclic-nucleotide phosphodiesterase [Batrachochytrium dendrobatidis]
MSVPPNRPQETSTNLLQRLAHKSASSEYYDESLNGSHQSRILSLGTTRTTVGLGIISRPVVWTKQSTLQKSTANAYMSQPIDIHTEVHVPHSSRWGELKDSGTPSQSSTSSILLNPPASNATQGSVAGAVVCSSGAPNTGHSIEKYTPFDIFKKSATHLSARQESISAQTSAIIKPSAEQYSNQKSPNPYELNLSQIKSSGTTNTYLKQSGVMPSTTHSYKDIIKNMGRPLRGPILREFIAHYLYFLLILFVAWKTSWAPQIRFHFAVAYLFESFLTINISRMVLSRMPASLIPYYLSFAPLVTIIFISREAHQVVLLLWFISFFIIFLQSGQPHLLRHIIIFCVIYFSIYIGVISIMKYAYDLECLYLYCSANSAGRIVFLQEAVLIFGCAFVMVIFGFLERFILLNTSILLDRENYIQHLYIANMDLKRQLRTAKTDNEVDLEAPLSRAAQILNEVKEIQDLDESIITELDFIIGLLSSDKLFQPDLFQNSNDKDVHDWLKDMLLTEKSVPESAIEAKENTAPIPAITLNVFSTSLCQVGIRAFQILDTAHDNPDFDVFDLEVVTSGHALYFMGWYLFLKHRFAERIGMDEYKFRSWLIKIESGYRRSNVYHNSTHAIDVAHSLNYFTTQPKIRQMLKVDEELAVLIAPIIHDYMHPGVNNAFLMATSNALALRYNDQSILEHFHCASLFEMTSNKELDIFSSLSLDQRKSVREMVISMVLATDMAFHFDWIGKFKSKLNGAGFNFETKSDKKIILNMAIKCADVNNSAKSQICSRRWTQLIMEEFFRQGDEEKARGMPISTFMNRETTDVPKCQLGFIDFIVSPLYETWSGYMKEDVDFHIKNIQANKAFWKSCLENPSLYTPVPLVSFNVTPAHQLLTATACKRMSFAIPTDASIPNSSDSNHQNHSKTLAYTSTENPQDLIEMSSSSADLQPPHLNLTTTHASTVLPMLAMGASQLTVPSHLRQQQIPQHEPHFTQRTSKNILPSMTPSSSDL